MPLVSEKKMLEVVDSAKSVLLVEPNYVRKYVPLGLAKISARVKRNGGKVTFARKVVAGKFDLVCVTSLFTYYGHHSIQETLKARIFHRNATVLVGGIAATLLKDRFQEETPDALLFPGYSYALDAEVPDYSINWRVEEPWDTYAFTFTTRGCPNKCAYCAVRNLEPKMWVNPNWKNHLVESKPNIMISDNNLSSFPEHLMDVAAHLKTLKKGVVFDNGFDCKLITPEIAKALSGIHYERSGLRMAFDRIAEDGIFQGAVKMLQGAGVSKGSMMAYCLFNFTDTPKEADYRMHECVKLGIRPYPQQYIPLSKESRDDKFISKKWTKRLLKEFRYFWLMGGLYQSKRFEKWARAEKKLTKEDWNAWNQE